MKYQKRRRLYSQNFLRSPKLIAKLIRRSSVGKKDTVLEIGSGKGIITQELINVAGKVIAVELDEKFYPHLENKFQKFNNLELHQENFLNFELPSHPYKVFANIPFIITADVIRKLTKDNNFTEGYLIVQEEAAKKLIGKPYDTKNQMMATLLKPWFEINVIWQFNPYDFIPRPNVDVVMIRIRRIGNPLIDNSLSCLYKYFVIYTYNRSKVTKLEFKTFIKLFKDFVENSNYRQKGKISSEARRILKHQILIKKIHRTRVDKNWRKFK